MAEKKCQDYIESYLKYLQGAKTESEKLILIKKHILNCKKCQTDLHEVVDAIDESILESDLKTSLSCQDVEDLAFDVFRTINDETREDIINHLLICKKCRDEFVDLFIERLDTDKSVLDYNIKIPEIKSPIILLELKKKRKKEVKRAIQLAESSIVKIKSDGGIKYGVKDLVEKRIETLPPWPSHVKMIIELIDHDADLRDITGEVRKDVSLSARILQIANSPYYRPVKPIEDIQRALSRIGLTSISRIVSVFGIYSVLVKEAGNHLHGYDIPMRIFMDYSTMIALISMLLAPRYMEKHHIHQDLSYDIDTVAYTAGLVENLGMIVLNHCIDKDSKKDIKRFLDKGMEIIKIEEALFGITHSEVGGKILKKWNLSDNLIKSIMSHHAPLGDIIRENNILSNIIYPADTIASELLRPTSKVVPYLNIIPSEKDFIDILPFNTREEVNDFYESQLIPEFIDQDITYDKTLYS